MNNGRRISVACFYIDNKLSKNGGKAMDSLKFLLYTLARIGLMLASLVLALIFGKLFFPILASFVPDSMSGINSFFTSCGLAHYAGSAGNNFS